MLKMKMIGLMLLMTFSSCVIPTIKKPVPMFVVNTRTHNVLAGVKEFNIKGTPKNIGEWVGETRRTKLDQINPNLTCFSTETWLEIIKPKMKEGSRAYHDR